MLITKQIVCLAKSQKQGGFCLAGKEVLGEGFGEWIRPVSETEHGELREENMRYKDGTTISLCEKCTIALKGQQQHQYQIENYIIKEEPCCTKNGKICWDDLKNMVKKEPRDLWNNESSSFDGVHDRVSLPILTYKQKSLRLVYLQKSTLLSQIEYGGKRKCRLAFEYYGVPYKLTITDPEVKAFFSHQKDDYQFPEAFCCVSLGVPFNGFSYKLVASIITKERIQDGQFSLHDRAL